MALLEKLYLIKKSSLKRSAIMVFQGGREGLLRISGSLSRLSTFCSLTCLAFLGFYVFENGLTLNAVNQYPVAFSILGVITLLNLYLVALIGKIDLRPITEPELVSRLKRLSEKYPSSKEWSDFIKNENTEPSYFDADVMIALAQVDLSHDLNSDNVESLKNLING